MKEKLVMQHDETDCAAACIASIAKYYGKNISISRIRRLAGTDQMGTSGLGIVKAGTQLGFLCKGGISNTKELSNEIPFPIILHLKKDLMDHYAVLYKSKNKKFLLADPDEGFKKVQLSDLEKIWSGIFFIFVPEQKFESVKNSNSVFSKFLFLLKPHKKTIFQCFLSGMILSLLGIVSSFYFRFLIDEVLYSELESTLTIMSLGYLVVILIQNLISFCRNQIIMYMSNKIDIVMIKEYLTHILKLPLDFFITRKTGEILSRLNDVSMIRNLLSSTFVTVIIDVFMFFFGGIFLFTCGSKLILVAMIPVLISAIVSWIFIRPYKIKLKDEAKLEAEKHSQIVESINNISVIKALSIENKIFERLETKIVNTIKKGIKLGSLSNTQNSIQHCLSQFGTLLIYWVGSIAIMNNEITLGQLISFVTLSGYFLGPFSRMLNLQHTLQECLISSERFCEVLDIDEEDADETSNENSEKNNLVKIEEFTKPIKIENLSFCYTGRSKVLDNISFEINPGEKVAFVGSSGSGKTTMVKLLMKFYSAQSGNIYINDFSISEIDTKSYRQKIAYVPQDVMLFSGTIAENITLGSDGATFEEIIEVSKKTKCYDFIQRLPKKFFTYVGEHGASLSGGERQRISLARVLIKNPDVLILDEATASLDSFSESEIMNTVNFELKNITTIIVAHRLSTIVSCDKIFVFDKGKIVERGTHDQLLLKNGFYKKMWDVQNNAGGKFIEKSDIA